MLTAIEENAYILIRQSRLWQRPGFLGPARFETASALEVLEKGGSGSNNFQKKAPAPRIFIKLGSSLGHLGRLEFKLGQIKSGSGSAYTPILAEAPKKKPGACWLRLRLRDPGRDVHISHISVHSSLRLKVSIKHYNISLSLFSVWFPAQ